MVLQGKAENPPSYFQGIALKTATSLSRCFSSLNHGIVTEMKNTKSARAKTDAKTLWLGKGGEKKTEGNKILNCKGCILFISSAFCSQVFHLTNVT